MSAVTGVNVRAGVGEPVMSAQQFQNKAQEQEKGSNPCTEYQAPARGTILSKNTLTTSNMLTTIHRVTCAVLLSDILGLALPSPAKLQSVLAQRRTTSTEVVLLAARAMIRTAPSSTKQMRPAMGVAGLVRSDLIRRHESSNKRNIGVQSSVLCVLCTR